MTLFMKAACRWPSVLSHRAPANSLPIKQLRTVYSSLPPRPQQLRLSQAANMLSVFASATPTRVLSQQKSLLHNTKKSALFTITPTHIQPAFTTLLKPKWQSLTLSLSNRALIKTTSVTSQLRLRLLKTVT